MFSAQNRIFRNLSRRYSTPSEQLIPSLEPLKRSNQVIFNGSNLDIGTARGAKNGNGQNRRKSQKKHEIADVKNLTRHHQRTLQKQKNAKSQPENNEE